MAHFIEDRPDDAEHNLFGFSAWGYHNDTRTPLGPDGYDQYGFNYRGIHKYTLGLYNEFGFNQRGFTKSGRMFLLVLIWINLKMTSMVNHNFMEMIALNKFREIQKRVLSR